MRRLERRRSKERCSGGMVSNVLELSTEESDEVMVMADKVKSAKEGGPGEDL